MTYDRRNARYLRVLRAMTTDQAKQMLGFPPGSLPSSTEIAKAYRAKAIENHPDRGGSHETMVDLNVAKDVLQGKRREDARPPVSWGGSEPKKDPEAERRAQRVAHLKMIADAAKATLEALEPAIQGADIKGHRISLPGWLDQDYHHVLDTMLDKIENLPPNKDLQIAKKYVHLLTGMAHRVSKRGAAISGKVGEYFAVLLEMSGDLTYKDMVTLYADFKKFQTDFEEFATESGQMVKLISTSENVPIEWDDLYGKAHSMITSFRDDYRRFEEHSLKRYERTLKQSVATVDEILSRYGSPLGDRSWDTWKVPGDFKEAADAVKRSAN